MGNKLIIKKVTGVLLEGKSCAVRGLSAAEIMVFWFMFGKKPETDCFTQNGLSEK